MRFVKQAGQHITTRLVLIAILVIHFALGVWYSILIPLWEGYDEPAHYAYVKYIADHRRLPGPSERSAEGFSQARLQPPLFYTLGALATFWIDTSDNLKPTPNPWASGTFTGGANMAIHSDAEAFPYHGTVLAIHAVRFLSVLMSTVTVVITYLMAGLIFPHRKDIALGAIAFLAFAPQFLFMGSFVSNDIALTMFSSIVLLFLLHMAIGTPRWHVPLAFSLALFLAILTKITAVCLVPLGMLGLFFAFIRGARKQGSRGVFLLGLAGGLVGGGLCSWWLVINKGLLGEPASWIEPIVRNSLALLRHNPTRVIRMPDWPTMQTELWSWFQTFWSSFGWGNVAVDEWIYRVMLVVCLAAFLGCSIAIVRKDRAYSTKLGMLFLGLDIILVVGLPTYKHLHQYGVGQPFWGVPYGRYSLPAICAVSVLIVAGLVALVPKGFSRLFVIALGMAMLTFAIIVSFRYIMPSYARPPLLTEGDLEDLKHPLHVRFGDKAELVGYDLDKTSLKPNDRLEVTLYWRSLTRMDENYSVAVKVLGPDGQIYGHVHTYPGHGNYATSLWSEEDIIRDTYRISIASDIPQPSMAQLSVSLFLIESLPPWVMNELSHHSLEHLPVFDPQGQHLGGAVIFERLKFVGEGIAMEGVPNQTRYDLGDGLALVGYDVDKLNPHAGDTLSLKLYWLARTPVEGDYTVFVHLVDRGGRIWAQMDGQPRGATYPTGLWDPGEIVEDSYDLILPTDMPPSEYDIKVGMYLLDTMERLPVYDDDGIRQKDDQILLETLALTERAR